MPVRLVMHSALRALARNTLRGVLSMLGISIGVGAFIYSVAVGQDTSQAQDIRLAAFALNCFVPTTAGLHTQASLVGRLIFANRTVAFDASCVDGPSASRF